MSTSLRSISTNQNTKECGNKSFQFFSYFCLSVARYFLPLDAQVKTSEMLSWISSLSVSRKNFNFQPMSLLVQTVQAAVFKAKAFIQTRKAKARLIVGIFLSGCLAPIADMFYAFEFLKRWEIWRFETVRADWVYYDNAAYLFLCLGPYISQVFAYLGGYFVFIGENTPRSRSWLFSLLLCYPVTKMLWLLQVTNKIEFHQTPTTLFYCYGLLIAVCLWFVAEYFIYMINHKWLNQASTMDNITNNRTELPAEKVVEMYATTWSKIKATQY